MNILPCFFILWMSFLNAEVSPPMPPTNSPHLPTVSPVQINHSRVSGLSIATPWAPPKTDIVFESADDSRSNIELPPQKPKGSPFKEIFDCGPYWETADWMSETVGPKLITSSERMQLLFDCQIKGKPLKKVEFEKQEKDDYLKTLTDGSTVPMEEITEYLGRTLKGQETTEANIKKILEKKVLEKMERNLFDTIRMICLSRNKIQPAGKVVNYEDSLTYSHFTESQLDTVTLGNTAALSRVGRPSRGNEPAQAARTVRNVEISEIVSKIFKCKPNENFQQFLKHMQYVLKLQRCCTGK